MIRNLATGRYTGVVPGGWEALVNAVGRDVTVERVILQNPDVNPQSLMLSIGLTIAPVPIPIAFDSFTSGDGWSIVFDRLVIPAGYSLYLAPVLAVAVPFGYSVMGWVGKPGMRALVDATFPNYPVAIVNPAPMTFVQISTAALLRLQRLQVHLISIVAAVADVFNIGIGPDGDLGPGVVPILGENLAGGTSRNFRFSDGLIVDAGNALFCGSVGGMSAYCTVSGRRV